MSELKAYTGKQLQTAIEMLQSFTPGADAEIIHQLRVSLKKLKAVLVFAATLNPEKTKKIRKKVQVLFRAAGSVREAQLQLQWLTKKRYVHLIEAAKLKQKISEEEALLLLQKEDYQDMLASVAKDLLKLIRKIKQEQVADYAVQLKKTVQQQLQAEEKEEWHALRKLIKQMLYVHHWLSEQEKLKIMPVLLYHVFDQLQEQIGTWHDLIDLQQWLTDQQFFLHQEPSIKQQSTKASAQLQANLLLQEQAVLRQLLVTKKPVKQK
jgi:CHAD domain-containing protein